MAMDKLVTYGVLGVGAYLLYEYFFATPATATATPVTGANMAVNNPAQTQVSPIVQPNQPAAANISNNTNAVPPVQNNTGAYSGYSATDAGLLIGKLLTASGQLGQTYDQWNYYFHQVTGIYGANWEDTSLVSGDRNTIIDVKTFLKAQGMGGISGLGFAIMPSYFERNLVRGN